MRLIDADVLLDNIRRDSKKAIDEGDKVGSFWLGYAAGFVIKQPTIQPVATDTNVGDTISRQAAIDGKIIIQRTNGVEIYYDEAVPVGYLKRLPPAQPEPKEEYWIRRDCGLDVECKCSKCGYRDFVEPRDEYWFKRNYCPNCGAKMKGAQNG